MMKKKRPKAHLEPYLKCTTLKFAQHWIALSDTAMHGNCVSLPSSITVVTYNVLFDLHHKEKIFTKFRRPLLLEQLRNSNADIICLQEVTYGTHQFCSLQDYCEQKSLNDDIYTILELFAEKKISEQHSLREWVNVPTYLPTFWRNCCLYNLIFTYAFYCVFSQISCGKFLTRNGCKSTTTSVILKSRS